MAEPKFNDGVAETIWEEIRTNGMYGRSKNDFYDFVLYTLNKHDPDHFLDENDNATNERLLKISATRIKAAKKNISVKFMDDGEYDQIFWRFIGKIADEPPLLTQDDDNGSSYTIMIEDTALRSMIEGKIKSASNTTIDYHRNRELVTVSCEAFLKMLAMELDKANPDVKGMLSDTLKDLEKQKDKAEAANAFKRIMKSESLEAFPINLCREILKFAVKKVSGRKK